MRACAVCGRPAAGGRCTAHALRGGHHSPLYRRNQRALLRGVVVGVTCCGRCGSPVTAEDRATVGHVLALAEGGTDDAANLQVEHESCNKRAGRLLQEAAPVWGGVPVVVDPSVERGTVELRDGSRPVGRIVRLFA